MMDACFDATLHGVAIRFCSSDERVAQRLRRQWAPFAAPAASADHVITIHLHVVPVAPAAPDHALVSAGASVRYYRQGERITAYFPGWGEGVIDLAAGQIDVRLSAACVRAYGVFEDMLVIALAPLFRRRGFFTLHAFAAAVGDRAVALVGDVATGKSTTGISLLCRGAHLIANDSPLLRVEAEAAALCAYPGLISAYPRTLAWFPALAGVLAGAERRDGSEKLSFAVDDVWPGAWRLAAPPALLLFPAIAPGLTRSELRPLSRFAAVQQLVSQSIEDWDSAYIPAHLHALRRLVELAPAYALRLAPDIEAIPDLILDCLEGTP